MLSAVFGQGWESKHPRTGSGRVTTIHGMQDKLLHAPAVSRHAQDHGAWLAKKVAQPTTMALGLIKAWRNNLQFQESYLPVTARCAVERYWVAFCMTTIAMPPSLPCG
jgi:hypothetical protein